MSAVIAWFARNRVAANLLMLMIVLSGLLAARFGVRREVFPIVSLDMVSVKVPYPGATPVEVEEGIILRIEEAIADLEGIDELNGTASEGAAVVVVKVRTDYDARELMDDIKTRVDAITTFPQDAEEPVVEELKIQIHVVTLAVSSATASERELRLLAEDLRTELLELPGITQVKLGGARPYEIGIHVAEESLRRHGLTFQQVADAVRASSLNLPAGSIRASFGDIRIRTQSQAYVGPEFENLVLLTNEDGTRVHLRDVARIVDGFEEDEQWTRFNGRRAITLTVMATGRENVTDVSANVHDFVLAQQDRLPAGTHLDKWFDFSRYYRERQSLMLRNGLSGLLLVFLCLALFLHLRLALWVAAGLAISFIGTFIVLWYTGTSINMISMAAFILVLGIVVDDAIVVSESIHHRQQSGEPGERGAVAGVLRVAGPVIFAVLTTVIAFLPLFAISGVSGKMWRIVPMVIVACLLFSLVESLLILPAHLVHEPAKSMPWYLLPIWPVIWAMECLQRLVDRSLQWFIRRAYRPLLALCLNWRYTTLAVFVACLVVAIGLIRGGRVPVAFFPRLPGDVAVATLEMPNGTSAQATREILDRIEAATEQLRVEFDGDGQQLPVIKHVLVSLGAHPVGEARDSAGMYSQARGPHLAEVAIEFSNLAEREISSQAIADRWRQLVGTVAGARQLTFDATDGDDAKDIHLRLSSENPDDIETAAGELREALAGFAGVYEIRDTLGSQQPEITLSLKPAAEPLGLRVQDLARQVRQAFYGEEAQRVQRGRDDIRVMVRYPPDQRRSVADLDNLRIRTTAGDEVPLGEVADVHFGRGLATIQRGERKRIVDVTALLDRAIVKNSEPIMNDLQAGLLADLPRRYPGMSWSREGGMKDQQQVLTEMGTGFIIALFAMYALMAIAFKSYSQPLLIAAAIPFGFVGAVAGHLLLGETFSIVSFIGMVALAGVVVNDSLVLIDAVNRLTRRGAPPIRAVRTAAEQRFRAILLTSLTTFLGLTPLMAETSFQARFIAPMAVTLAFGVAFATVITLTLIPCLYAMTEDARRWRNWIAGTLSTTTTATGQPESRPGVSG